MNVLASLRASESRGDVREHVGPLHPGEALNSLAPGVEIRDCLDHVSEKEIAEIATCG